jgi:lysophospholipase L1-like esterase
MKNKLFITYILTIHILLLTIIIKSDFLSQVQSIFDRNHSYSYNSFYRTTSLLLANVDGNVPDNSILFFGNSITQGLCVSAVSPKSVNFGIGADTTAGLLERLRDYKSLEKAEIVVIEIGINDVLNGVSLDEMISNYRKIFNSIPSNVGIVYNDILPINQNCRVIVPASGINKQISAANTMLNELCQMRSGCFRVSSDKLLDSTGCLNMAYDYGDGFHFNTYGYLIWIEELRREIGKAQKWTSNKQ